MTTLHLTLKMTTAQVVEMSVTNNSLSKDYLHPDDQDKPITEEIILTFPEVLYCIDFFHCHLLIFVISQQNFYQFQYSGLVVPIIFINFTQTQRKD